jgi:hypothetical protein
VCARMSPREREVRHACVCKSRGIKGGGTDKAGDIRDNRAFEAEVHEARLGRRKVSERSVKEVCSRKSH